MKNGVSRIVNYVKRTDLSDTTYQPSVAVTGKDSGIRHSFEVTQDQFATGSDKRLVNYRNYYFVAIAYSYNQFAPFNINNVDSSQDKPYLESAHGQGGAPIPVMTAMPNPANGNMGTVLNADYGSGVIIQRIEGTGNGGNILELTDESETAALSSPYIAANPKYRPGAGRGTRPGTNRPARRSPLSTAGGPAGGHRTRRRGPTGRRARTGTPRASGTSFEPL